MPNSVSEWFGHRVCPTVAADTSAQTAQKKGICPFLTTAFGTQSPQLCVKQANSRGVCTVSSDSNGARQDWVVCPYRTIDSPIFLHSTHRLFALARDAEVLLVPAPALRDKNRRDTVNRHLKSGKPAFVFFMDKLGGEIDLPGSKCSPKFKLDATIVELLAPGAAMPEIGRYAVVEIQTMDFHGSYKHATTSLTNALRLHPENFAKQLRENPHWASEEIEGPNISNVFKRTIYQILFKLRLGLQPECSGCVLALPQAVWDSWQPHLGAPKFVKLADQTWTLAGHPVPAKQPGWLSVFDIDAQSKKSPNPIVVRQEIRLDVEMLSKLAFEVAPEEAMKHIGGDVGLKSLIQRRMAEFWPEAFTASA